MKNVPSRRWVSYPSRKLWSRGPEQLEDRTTPNVAFAVTATDLLVLDTAAPGTATTKAITGLEAGEQVAGIDARPFDGKLYALGLNDVANTGRLYTIDAATGVATKVGTATLTLNSTFYGFDFNPVVDRIRVVGDTGENLRLNPNDGTVAGTDAALNPAGPVVTLVAYDRNINFKPDAAAAAPAGTLTTLFGIDSVGNQLVRIGGVDGTPSPNDGTVTNVGPLGVDVVATGNGFDIDGGSGKAFAVMSVVGFGSQLYTVDLATGTATLVAPLSTNVLGFAALPRTVLGTDANDVIEVAANPSLPGTVLVTINGVPKGAFGNTAASPLLIQAGAGDDTIRLSDGVVLTGGQADGGAGVDTLDYSLWTTGVTVNLSDAANPEVLFRATLDGGQEVPPVATAAKGTATVVYNVNAKTFDLRMDVTGITRDNLTMSHFHAGAVGVNGPVFIDLGDGTQWTDVLTGGIGRTASGAVPADKLADLLAGNAYLNVHTKAVASGEVRGQLQLVGSNGTATGFGGVVGFENVLGGSGGDTVTGNDLVNTFKGGAGVDVLLGRGNNDLVVGDKGNDQMFGGEGNDTLVWNNGDGSDVMEGGGGADTVQANGGTGDETFTIAPNGERLAFARVTPAPFTLDIGTAETMLLNGNAGVETVTAAPSKTVAYVLSGGDSAAVPGDKLTLNLAGVSGSTLTTPFGGSQGQYTFPDGFQPVTFDGFESFAPVTTPFAVGAGQGGGPIARVFSPSGTPLFDQTVFDGTFTGGVRVAMGDFNGDGTLDMAVGTGPGIATRVRVLDGLTKAELFTIEPFEPSFTGGVFVAMGDVNGDGFADLAITPDEGGGPRARVFSGKDKAQLADYFGIEDVNFRGGARPALGDITGDGKADLVVAAGFTGGPRVGVFDGAKLAAEGNLDNQTFSRWNTWKPFGDFLTFEEGLRNGSFVAVGDTNGDGFGELIAGGGPGGGPRVSVFNGKELLTNVQTRIADYFAGDTNNRGGIRVAAKNLDGDGKADLVVGAGTGAGSRVTGYLGKNLAPTGTPPEQFGFETFAGFTGGVFVG